MSRPRRDAATKPQGYYSPPASIGLRRTSTGRVSKLRKVKGQTGQVAAGSSQDASPPTSMIIPGPLDTAALERDLQNSYEGKIAPPDLPKRQTRWQQPASKPIFDLAEVPKGWNSLEPDLDPEYVFPASVSTWAHTNICYTVTWYLRSQGAVNGLVIIS
jgi:hypothetical protein